MGQTPLEMEDDEGATSTSTSISSNRRQGSDNNSDINTGSAHGVKNITKAASSTVAEATSSTVDGVITSVEATAETEREAAESGEAAEAV